MTFDPKSGDVFRYDDFVWKSDEEKGHVQGLKEKRPCVVVRRLSPLEDGTQRAVVAGISHTPPRPDEGGVEIPHKVGRYLGLDDDRSWIKTHEVNVMVWPEGQIPHGVAKEQGQWRVGQMPQGLGKKAHDEVMARFNSRTLTQVVRTTDPPPVLPPPPKPDPADLPKVKSSDRSTLTLPKQPQDKPPKPRRPLTREAREERRERGKPPRKR